MTTTARDEGRDEGARKEAMKAVVARGGRVGEAERESRTAVIVPPRGKKFGGLAIGGACLAAGVAIGMAFGGSSEEAQAPSSVQRPIDRAVTLPEELAKRAGIRTVKVEEKQVTPTVSLVGAVQFDQQRVADVGSPIEGRILRMLVSVGESVERGEALAQLESPQLGEMVANLLSARARLKAATTGAAREASLGERQLATAVSVETARASQESLAAEVRGIEQQLLAMGMTDGELNSIEKRLAESINAPVRRVTIRAPIAGEVVERYAMLGQVVDPTEPVLRVADMSKLWVTLEVFERDLARVKVGDSAEILSETYPGQTFHGVVSHIDAQIEERTRTAGVRIEVDNPDRKLRPGQFVHALLSTGGAPRQSMVIPEVAVVQLDGEPTVFIGLGNNRYEPRAIRMGARFGEQVEVLAGLSPGENLVVEGAFALKSEMQR